MVVDDLYQENRPRNKAELPFDLRKATEHAIQSLYEHHSKPSDLVPEELFREIVRTLDSAVDVEFQEEFPDLCRLIHENNGVFAAFKVHDQCERMAELLTDEEGSLRPFNDWRKLAEPIANHHNRVWLRTEYDTAVKRANLARQWKQFEAESDVLPNLRWLPSTAATPGEDHKIFWGTVRPINDPFWDQHKPGDRWGCQCSLEATDDTVTDIPGGEDVQRPDDGLDNNPAKDGKLFGDSHPYFPDSCNNCPFYSGNENSAPTNKYRDCVNCTYYSNCVPEEIDEDVDCFSEIETKNGHLKVHILHGKNEYDENTMIGSYLSEKHGYDITLLPKRDDRKCADSFNNTLGTFEEYKKPTESSKTSIDNAIRDAHHQRADAVIIYIDTDINEDNLTRGIKGRIGRCPDIKYVTIIRGGIDVTYDREDIVKKGWKAKWTDLK